MSSIIGSRISVFWDAPDGGKVITCVLSAQFDLFFLKTRV